MKQQSMGLDQIAEGMKQINRATQETLASLEHSVRTYDETGQRRTETLGAQLIDRSI